MTFNAEEFLPMVPPPARHETEKQWWESDLTDEKPSKRIGGGKIEAEMRENMHIRVVWVCEGGGGTCVSSNGFAPEPDMFQSSL
jgi:hypothetical protein